MDVPVVVEIVDGPRSDRGGTAPDELRPIVADGFAISRPRAGDAVTPHDRSESGATSGIIEDEPHADRG